jgi:hypothetical protein
MKGPMPPSALNTGDTVTFTDKYLRKHVGAVIRIDTKTLSVQCGDSTWRAPHPFWLNSSTFKSITTAVGQDGLLG